ncbi:MAG TPA: 6-bladed beta-propeller [Bacteroidales bacterium]|nr:6-bladed beta-propeller [Bacteroidales bacterium]
MNSFLKILFVFIILCSCSKNAEKKYKAEKLNVDPDAAEQVNLSQFVDNIEYVKLSSKKNAYIGSIEKVIVTEDRIYVLDAYNSVDLFVFDRKGNFLFDLGKYGRGPGEFMGPYDFAIDWQAKEIVIYDARGIKLSFFNLEDGRFIRDERLDFRFRRFDIYQGTYIFYLDNPINKDIISNIIIRDKNLRVIDEHLKIKPDLRGVHFLMPTNFSHYKKSLFFTAPFDYSIYLYRDKVFKKYISVDFGDRNAPEAYYGKYARSEDRWKARGDAAYGVSNYFESDNFTFFLYWINSTAYYYFSSKRDDTVIHTNNEKLNDDLGVGPLIRWPNAIYKNTLVWYQQPTTLLYNIDKKKEEMTKAQWASYAQKHKKLLSFARTISRDDNPYLIFMKIKI